MTVKDSSLFENCYETHFIGSKITLDSVSTILKANFQIVIKINWLSLIVGCDLNVGLILSLFTREAL